MTRRKALGQHFLTSRRVLDKIIAVIAPHADDLIVEIGPGRGALTFPLAERCGRLIAIEKDASLIPRLLERKPVNVEIIEQDILRADLGELVGREPCGRRNVRLVGNLPYSISSPLLFKVLDEKERISDCVFLLQKEVAERVAARPGSKKYAPISILFQLDFEVSLHFEVAPAAFSPPPRVRSTLISFKRRESPLFAVSDPARLRPFLRTAFAERRKTLVNNLRKLGRPADAVKRALAAVSLPDKIRAEQVDIARLVELFEALRAI
jgi:16S rRNA (adenine1518-N6/adenine1519-N6)-dimethyltransferase